MTERPAPPRPIPARPGLGAPRRRLAEILRVDHAGELAAVNIYRGQRAVLEAGRPALARDFARKAAEEHEHLDAFDKLLTDRRVRPSLLAPLWRTAAFALGAGTALMGERAAHACTEAVETVIEEHYDSQIEELRAAEPALAEQLSGFRDDERGHRLEAVAAGAQAAPGHALLSAIIRAGCRAAIRVAEKV